VALSQGGEFSNTNMMKKGKITIADAQAIIIQSHLLNKVMSNISSISCSQSENRPIGDQPSPK
jgi:hypothetical protein